MRATLLAIGLTLLAACARAPGKPLRLEWPVMGTVAAVQGADHAATAQAREIVRELFDESDRDFSNWRDDSLLTIVNKAAGGGQPSAIPPTVRKLMRQALDASKVSGGAFNPLLGPVMELWGFNGAKPAVVAPSPVELGQAMTLAEWRSIELRDDTLYLPIQGMRLDLGAIAKGYAVDLAWQRLKDTGHSNLLIDLGGNLRALGEAAPGRGGWRTGIRNPFQPESLAGHFILGDGEATATSGHYERFVMIGGQRYAHILDGRTGAPVTGMAAVTVVAPDATTADALSTMLFVLGPAEGTRLLRQFPGCAALWIPDQPQQPTVIVSPNFQRQLWFVSNFSIL